MNKRLFSTSEAAKILGISRIAVFKKIKSGEIKAKKTGRNFVIESNEILPSLGSVLGPQKKHQIEQSVKKTVREYGETLRLLGKE
ncbi:MAG: helix-turn-helix domain-containing protein [Patescibacteria group bacterium]